MPFNKFLEFVFLGVFSCAVYVLWEINQSVQSLNEKIAVVIERQATQGEELKVHENRIRDLEFKKK